VHQPGQGGGAFLGDTARQKSEGVLFSIVCGRREDVGLETPAVRLQSPARNSAPAICRLSERTTLGAHMWGNVTPRVLRLLVDLVPPGASRYTHATLIRLAGGLRFEARRLMGGPSFPDWLRHFRGDRDTA